MKRHTFESLIKRVAVCEHGEECTLCCWPWLGSLDSKGYPNVTYHNKAWIAGKLIFSLKKGIPLDVKYSALHSCDNPPCCNWNHIYQGNQSKNMQDMIERSRHPLIGQAFVGEDHPQAKMTYEQVKEARLLHEQDGATIGQLCKMFPVKRSQMQRILSYQKWKG